ncbi:hypothetical protein [Arthrobacter sp. EpRS71]|uniref:hypothetical protein n=1 Tax=Arthrobacter sp. EpRS71 TaxID=1743141 RepID=UPI000A414F2A|nr:hypothetical protein [Arthrobacter sp. EpRS71]
MTAVVVRAARNEAVPGVGPGANAAPEARVAPELAASASGASQRTGLLDEVWTASARVEGLQWEMDEAEGCLAAAMRKATAGGAGLPDLAIASGLSFARIERLLE